MKDRKKKIAVIIAVMAIVVAGCDNSRTINDLCEDGHDWNWTEVVWGMETGACSHCAEIIELRLSPGMLVRLPPTGTAPFTFTMGSDDTQDWNAQPAHQVTLTRGFYMGTHQVTQAQFEAVMGENPSAHAIGGTRESFVEGLDTSRFPVERVRWFEAIIFCNRLSKLEDLTPAYEIETAEGSNVWSTDPAEWGEVPTGTGHENFARWNNVRLVEGSTGYRLPTEAQWEFACRAGRTTPWNTGDSITQEQANFWGAVPLQRTTAVGSFPANAWGLYDMHGNVWEWVWDRGAAYTGEAQTDPIGASSGSLRVWRGGGWSDGAQLARSAVRNWFFPSHRYYGLGFRVSRP